MKLSDIADLANLLGTATPAAEEKKTGYDGKPVVLKIAMDSKGRKGKSVTLIRGFQSSPTELEELAQSLKKLCGTGGKAGDNTIELQGDHIQKVRQKLSGLGYTIK